LDEHHSFLWARSKLSADIKCDSINNNLAKYWNAWIKELKDLPLHCMADAIREKIMVLFAKKEEDCCSIASRYFAYCHTSAQCCLQGIRTIEDFQKPPK